MEQLLPFYKWVRRLWFVVGSLMMLVVLLKYSSPYDIFLLALVWYSIVINVYGIDLANSIDKRLNDGTSN